MTINLPMRHRKAAVGKRLMWSVTVVTSYLVTGAGTVPAADAAAAAGGAIRQHDHAGDTGARKAIDLGVVSLDVYADGGRLHLLTARRDVAGAAPRVEYRQSGDGGATWCSPVIVGGDGQATPGPVKRGADAQIAAKGDKLVAAWTTAGTLDRMGRGPIETAVSIDGGRTWRGGPNPSDSGAAIGHAFIDLAADERGTFHVVWLDGRDQPLPTAGTSEGKEEKRDASAPTSGKGLRYARSTDGGLTWSANRTLVEKTCECCWNTLSVAPDGRMAVLYRQYAPRDMAVITSDDYGNAWDKPAVIGDFKWDVNACPHVGGGFAWRPDKGAGTAAVATVWTARPGGAGGYVLATGGAGWSSPRPIGGEPAAPAAAAAWHTDVAAAPGGKLVIVYDAYAGTGSSVFAVTSADGGTTWSPPKKLSATGASASHPRVLYTGHSFRAFWTAKAAVEAPAAWQSAELSAE